SAPGDTPGRDLDEHRVIHPPCNPHHTPGLPPTPMAGVRGASLLAAAHPEDTEFLYYVLIDEEGRHGFSTTLEEHQEKVEQARADGILP
ncbi:MAG: endolytic transglycosylase MltG, partial [Acidimicrobiia bacterium]